MPAGLPLSSPSARRPAPCPALPLPRPPAVLAPCWRSRGGHARPSAGQGGERTAPQRTAPQRTAPHRSAQQRTTGPRRAPPPLARPPVTCPGPAAAAPRSNRAPPRRAVSGRGCGEAVRAAGRAGSGWHGAAGGAARGRGGGGPGGAGGAGRGGAAGRAAGPLPAAADLRECGRGARGVGLGSPLPALPSSFSPHRSPSPPPDRRGGHPHRREPLPAPAALRERGECRARAAPSGAREAAGSGAASPSPSSRAGPILQVSERYRCHEKGTLPPHIFAVADRAYQAMLGRRGARPQSQCIVIR